VCVVGPFSPTKGGVAVQTILLERFLKREEVCVVRIDTTLEWLSASAFKYLRVAVLPFYVFLKMLFVLRKCDAVQLQSCSYWGFIPALIGAPVAKLFKKRSIVFYMGGQGPEFFERYGWLVRRILRTATVTAACSAVLVEAFERGGIKTELLNNIFDSDSFRFRERTTIKPKLIWTRSFFEEYNPMMAVRAFELIKKGCPEATLIMTSDGIMKPTVEEYIKQKSIKGIELSGKVSRKLLVQMIVDADVWINTSSVDGLPTSILEAAATGLVIVTTPAGGIPDVFVDKKSVVLVDFDDYKAMVESVLSILNNPVNAVQLGLEAGFVAGEYTWAHEWPKLRQFYGFE